MAPGTWLAAATVVGLAACSPFGGGAFTCANDTQCGPNGTCAAGGFCAFPSTTCESGLQYGDLSGAMSNQCVGGGVDGGDLDGQRQHDSGFCYGTGFGATCFTAAPTGSVTLTNPINTDGALCSTEVVGSPGWCTIAGATISSNSAITVTGSKPLVLVSLGAISLTGGVDIASHRGGQTGAGSIPVGNAACNAGTGPGTSGGGAGGSFGLAGGNGADPTHGVAGAVEPTTMLRGGCAGQDGAGGTFGLKGLGGGAIYLIGSSISLTGSLNASGAGATPGVITSAGGGGGGAGGMIGLDAPTVMCTGAIFANGGGGAEGSGNSTTGNPGNESANGAAAPATASLSNGGEGGNGGAQGVAAGAGVAAATYGGGGGGGGVGAIRLFQATTISGSCTVSPAAS